MIMPIISDHPCQKIYVIITARGENSVGVSLLKIDMRLAFRSFLAYACPHKFYPIPTTKLGGQGVKWNTKNASYECLHWHRGGCPVLSPPLLIQDDDCKKVKSVKRFREGEKSLFWNSSALSERKNHTLTNFTPKTQLPRTLIFRILPVTLCLMQRPYSYSQCRKRESAIAYSTFTTSYRLLARESLVLICHRR